MIPDVRNFRFLHMRLQFSFFYQLQYGAINFYIFIETGQIANILFKIIKISNYLYTTR